MRLDVWLDGVEYPAGSLQSFDSGAVNFRYSEDYITNGTVPLSQSLALQHESYDDVLARAFFDNLLPENDQTRRLIEREGISRDDIVGILSHLGADCSGAISCLPEGSAPVKVPGDLDADYEVISDAAAADIMASLSEYQRLPDGTQDPSPLAGVQGKIALTVLADGRWALPKPGRKVPSTHILKVPARSDQADVKHEWAACVFMTTLNLPTSLPRRVARGGVEGLLITRFDRRVSNNKVFRIHQEDFAQALGLPRGLKYERQGREGRSFNASAVDGLLGHVKVPATDKRLFILATLMNLALGNNDNHAKNHGLLYVDGSVPVLAPFYDILPVRLNDRYTEQLAFDVGNAKRLEDITPEDVEAFFAAFGIGGTRYRRFLETEVSLLFGRLDALANDLIDQGMKSFDDLIGDNLKCLSEVLELNVQLRERDLFIARGGGWLSGS